jgi:hypothetical protein
VILCPYSLRSFSAASKIRADQSQTFLPHNANYGHFTDLSSFAPKQFKEERKVCSLPNNAVKMNFITQWKHSAQMIKLNAHRTEVAVTSNKSIGRKNIRIF